MSNNKTVDGQDASALAKALPQLGTVPGDSQVQNRPEAAGHLQAVPSPSAAAANQPPMAAPGTVSGLGVFANVPVVLVFEAGRQDITVQQLMTLTRGSILPLHNVFVDALKVKVSGITIARAEAISLKKRVGVRVNEIVIPAGLRSG